VSRDPARDGADGLSTGREELALYARERAGWVASGLGGRWVAISGAESFGFFTAQSEAYAQSVRHFAQRTFVLMEVRTSARSTSDLLPFSKSKPPGEG
jgi:hypothetical protein